ncbi:MAG: dihydroorotase, partial [Muribaculaceae bacterium]|nr:dihydroorotase [Muribaculaceae bacterium]
MNIHIKNADVYTPSGLLRTDVMVSSGRVVSMGEDCASHRADRVIDAVGLTLLPGLTDMHVHFREPGYSYKETIATGCSAAAAGGYTMVCTMPNVNPAPDSIEHLRVQSELIEAAGSDVAVIPYATITTRRMGKDFPDYEALAPYVAGFSDDGTGVQSAEVMREAMHRIAATGRIVAAHCEVDALLDGGYIHKGEYAARHGHKGISSESEWREIERNIELAAPTGCRLHICHISTSEGVELVRQAKKEGLDVTCETGPHYLWFSDMDLQEDGRFKMNPPLRSPSDRESLCEGVMDGTIDVIATDHAPHSGAEKSKGLAGSAMGVVGLETAFGAVYTR